MEKPCLSMKSRVPMRQKDRLVLDSKRHCRVEACLDRNLPMNTQNRYSHTYRFQQKSTGKLSIVSGGVVHRAANWDHSDCWWQSYHNNEYAPTLQLQPVNPQSLIPLRKSDQPFGRAVGAAHRVQRTLTRLLPPRVQVNRVRSQSPAAMASGSSG